MGHVLVVANLAATFGGNFVESLVALQSNVSGGVTYVLPEGAKGREWLPRLGDVRFTDWSLGSLHRIWQEVAHEEPISIVHLHFIGLRDGVKCRLAFGKARYIFHTHNHFVVESPNPIKKILKYIFAHYMYHGAYKIGVSQSVSDSVAAISPQRVYTIYNALNLGRLEKVGEEHVINPADQIRCMIMGNHYERKGVDIAARAIAELRSSGHDIVLYVAMNDYFRPAFENFICKMMGKLPEWIRPIPARNDIATYYRKMDFFLSPSREEGFPYATCEAAYCGCEVIASTIGGQNESKVPNVNWIGDPNKSDIHKELADKILELMRFTEKEREQRTDIVRKYIVQNMSMQNWVQQVLSVYEA